MLYDTMRCDAVEEYYTMYSAQFVKDYYAV
jgi:hypothetical protein